MAITAGFCGSLDLASLLKLRVRVKVTRVKMAKRIVPLFILALLVPWVAACGDQAATPTAPATAVPTVVATATTVLTLPSPTALAATATVPALTTPAAGTDNNLLR